MNKRQLKKELRKAEKEFKETVGASFVFLRANTDYDDSLIIMGLIDTLMKTVKEIQEAEN